MTYPHARKCRVLNRSLQYPPDWRSSGAVRTGRHRMKRVVIAGRRLPYRVSSSDWPGRRGEGRRGRGVRRRSDCRQAWGRRHFCPLGRPRSIELTQLMLPSRIRSFWRPESERRNPPGGRSRPRSRCECPSMLNPCRLCQAKRTGKVGGICTGSPRRRLRVGAAGLTAATGTGSVSVQHEG